LPVGDGAILKMEIIREVITHIKSQDNVAMMKGDSLDFVRINLIECAAAAERKIEGLPIFPGRFSDELFKLLNKDILEVHIYALCYGIAQKQNPPRVANPGIELDVANTV
jgi:hypothetical protein